MPNFRIWIRNPYPFRWEEQKAIEEALGTTYGGKPVYFKEWSVHSLSLEGVTLTTAKQVATALKFIHRQSAILDRRTDSRVYAEDCEVEVRGAVDGRPDWASQEK